MACRHNHHMAERPWGFWTESKLDMLSAYLPAFTTASKNKASATVYLDLFAGQELNVGRHTGEPIKGSLRRALETVPQFSVLRGFELRRDRAASLEGTYRADFPQRDVRVLPGDVHEELEPALRRLSNLRWAPTFAFIDPDGVEARWSLLESLAAYKHERSTKVELFMLLLSPQIGRVVHGYNDAENKA